MLMYAIKTHRVFYIYGCSFVGVRKIAPRSGSGFGLGLALELGLGGNFPRGAIFLEPFYCAPSIVTVV